MPGLTEMQEREVTVMLARMVTTTMARVGRGAVRDGGPSRAPEGVERGEEVRGPMLRLAKEPERDFW